jgi:hypothetical protein
VEGHGDRFREEHGKQIDRRDPGHGGGSPCPRTGAPSLAVEHGDLSQETTRLDTTQDLFTLTGGLDDFHPAVDHEADALGRVALMKKILARYQVLVNQVAHEPLAASGGKTF